MMTRLKIDLEKELEVCMAESTAKDMQSHKQAQVRSQIKHLEDQMKCVVFVLMQCQIGLESCSEMKPEDGQVSGGAGESRAVV